MARNINFKYIPLDKETHARWLKMKKKAIKKMGEEVSHSRLANLCMDRVFRGKKKK